jgi:hypothetical protein
MVMVCGAINKDHRQELIDDLDSEGFSWWLRKTCIDTDTLVPVSSQKIPELPETINRETLSPFAQWELVEMILASPRAAKLPKFSKERNILNFLEHERVVGHGRHKARSDSIRYTRVCALQCYDHECKLHGVARPTPG